MPPTKLDMKHIIIIIVLSLTIFTATAEAHRLQPAYLEINEQTAGKFSILWKRPFAGNRPMNIYPRLPAVCSNITEPVTRPSQSAAIERWLVGCGESGMANETITIDGLSVTQTDVLVRIYYIEGDEETHLLRPASASIVVGGVPSRTEMIIAYLQLGIQHILMGVDHLLFVLGLLLIVQSRWMLLKTITAFTLAHSITLGIATLGYASVPLPPLNAVIALSILFLGPEIVRSWQGGTSLTIRHPWVVAFAFGLLHGFGFATGLTNLGLRATEIPLALLLFNLGVEIGQVIFVMLVILLERSFRILEIHWPKWVRLAPGYMVGSLGGYWAIQRTVILVGGLL
ncbi:MAG: HupE/UreJ family protein [Deltaproteobacteria bacterium]|nr:HupE/UreJ family protein [Deltaproteobacteria bacterium]